MTFENPKELPSDAPNILHILLSNMGCHKCIFDSNSPNFYRACREKIIMSRENLQELIDSPYFSHIENRDLTTIWVERKAIPYYFKDIIRDYLNDNILNDSHSDNVERYVGAVMLKEVASRCETRLNGSPTREDVCDGGKAEQIFRKVVDQAEHLRVDALARMAYRLFLEEYSKTKDNE